VGAMKMTLNDIWDTFSDRMCEIELYHRASKDMAKSELAAIAEQYKVVEKNPEWKEMSSSYHNMTFYDAKTGTIRFYGHRERSIEDRYLHALLHKNKQYQWLLAEAYEEFEDFLEKIYAYLGKLDNDFWPLNDFGSITLSELPSKDFEWHLKQAAKKKDIPDSLLNRFRKKFPQLKSLENTNALKINIALAIALIEKLRHIIVHKGGVASDKQNFIKITLESVGLYNNGNPNEEHINFINQYFGSAEHENLIRLLEIKVIKDIPINIEHDVLGGLMGFMMAYALLLLEEINQMSSNENA
jgi:hypothetical protein